MNFESDAMERELESLKPSAVSRDLRRRIGEQIGEATSHETTRWSFSRCLLAGSLAAAAVVIAIFLYRPAGEIITAWFSQPERVEKENSEPPLAAASSFDVPNAPTLQFYHRALSESTESLDAALAQHASRYGGGIDSTASVYSLLVKETH